MKEGQDGFTILEILIGVSVFSVGLLGILGLLMVTVNATAFSVRLTEANFLATSTLEDLIHRPFNDASLQDTDSDGTVAPYGLHDSTVATADGSLLAQGNNNTNYDIFWNIAPNRPNPGSTTVCVTVVWREKGFSRQISMVGVKINEI